MQVTYEFDLTLYKIDRDVYSVLDWVGDVGGLNEGLFIFFKVILSLFQYRALEHFLIEHLYLKDAGPGGGTGGKDTSQDLSLRAAKTRLCRQKCLECLPRCLQRGICRASDEERYFAKGRQLLRQELDIVQFVRKIRRLEAIIDLMKKLLDLKDPTSHELRAELKFLKL